MAQATDVSTGRQVPVSRIHVDTVNPTANNDNRQGVMLGDMWLNTTTAKFYICLSNATAAATWNGPY